MGAAHAFGRESNLYGRNINSRCVLHGKLSSRGSLVLIPSNYGRAATVNPAEILTTSLAHNRWAGSSKPRFNCRNRRIPEDGFARTGAQVHDRGMNHQEKLLILRAINNRSHAQLQTTASLDDVASDLGVLPPRLRDTCARSRITAASSCLRDLSSPMLWEEE